MYKLMGTSIFTGSMKDAISIIDAYIRKGKRSYVCVTGVHGVVESNLQKDVFRSLLSANMVVPDGMPLVWLGRFMGCRSERIYGPDLMKNICELSQKNAYRIYLYGGDKDALSRLKYVLVKVYNNICIVGAHSPPHRPPSVTEQKQIVQMINRAKPHIVFVGLSTPKQELWMNMFRKYLHANVLIGVGAAFDFIAGTKPQAPVWMRSIGLEWLFRVIHEPRRLLPRYIKCAAIFLPIFVQQVARYFFSKFASFMRKYQIISIIIISFVLISVYCAIRISVGLPGYVSYGEIFNNAIIDRGTLIYGTSYTKLYFLDTHDIQKATSVDLNIGTVNPQFVFNRSVVAISGDTLWRIDTLTKKTLWQYTSDHQYDMLRSERRGDTIFTSIKDGSLVALRAKDGVLRWKYIQKQITALSSILVNGNISYFGDFLLDDQVVYVAGRDGVLSALRIHDGSVLWKNDFASPITSGPLIYGNSLFITTKDGQSVSLDKRSGRILWKRNGSKTGIYTDVFLGLSLSKNAFVTLAVECIESLCQKLHVCSFDLMEVYEDGVIVRKNGNNGQEIWKTAPLGKGLNRPVRWFDTYIFTSSSGDLISLNLNTGHIRWKKSGFGSILVSPTVTSRFIAILPHWVHPMLKSKYLFGDLNGDVWSLDGDQGDIRWKFYAGSPIYTQPLVVTGNATYVTTSDGMVYAIHTFTGKPRLPYEYTKFFVVQTARSIGKDRIVELTVTNTAPYDNPWREALLSATFSDGKGRQIVVPGFYYDTNTWKIRFNPPRSGEWKWDVEWMPFGGSVKQSGTFFASTNSSNSYLKIDKTNLKRFTVDGKTIFNGIGFGESMYDVNRNGTYLDDWAIGNSHRVSATDSSGITRSYKSDAVISLQKYIDTYGPYGAGFNMFRWSLMNVSGSLWRDAWFPMVYSIHDGKHGDELSEVLKANNIHVWLAMFGFDVPYQYSATRSEKTLLRAYIRYVIARYGAYVDVWEIANELTLSKNFLIFIIQTIREFDYQQRPISTSWEEPDVDGIDIISPHWYESENISESDIKMSNNIQKYQIYNKPIVFGEQGNKEKNTDETSAIRMRIRAWTAFFEEGILMFWNQSDSTSVISKTNSNANLYIGEKERAYIRHLQDFTQQFSLKYKLMTLNSGQFGFRGYALSSDEGIAGYVYHFADWKESVLYTSILSIARPGRIQWFDPSTGKVMSEYPIDSGIKQLTSPVFVTDIAFRLIYEK